MTANRAYKLSLALPIIVPIIAVCLIFIESSFSKRFNELLLITIYSGFVGGIPYLVVSCGILFWARKRPIRSLKIGLLCSPFFMIPFLWLFLVIQVLRDSENENWRWVGFWDWIGTYSIFVLIFGYSYILIVFGSIWGLQKWGYIEKSSYQNT